MADDNPQQTLVVNGQVNLSCNISGIQNLNSVVLPVDDIKNVTTDDILQQALNEAGSYGQSGNPEGSGFLHDRIQHLSDHSYIHSSNSNNFISNSEMMNSQDADSVDSAIGNGDLIDDETHLQSQHIEENNSADGSQINKSPPSAKSTNDIISMNCIENNRNVAAGVASSGNTVQTDASFLEPSTSTATTSLNTQYNLQAKESAASPSASSDLISLKVPLKQTTAPVGSVKNPIQIIQHGNSYHATQTLTPAQLQQITHVLQQQHAKKGFQNGAKSVLYDASTNTRIVCRVVHPSELQKKNTVQEKENPPKIMTGQSSAAGGRGRGRPRKGWTKKPEEDDKGNPMLSKEEREEKKKHRPRTRSGRISKPPSYMVKDYKRIHHLDFNEEPYDDSDGGYSDYNVSDEDGKNWKNKGNLPAGVTTAKKRSYSCSSCSKAYIGRGGLSRHYRLNPKHGSMPEGEDVSTQDENSNSSLSSSILSSSGCNSQNNTGSSANPPAIRFEPGHLISPPNPMASSEVTPPKHKARLTEVLKSYPEEEILDAMLPRLVNDLSLWDFFLAKCEKDKLGGPDIFTMLRQFEGFLNELRTEAQHSLCPATLDQENQGKIIINISSKEIAGALSIETGAYFVRESVSRFSEQKNLSRNYNTDADIVASPPPTKRKRTTIPTATASIIEDVSLPDQILQEGGDSLLVADGFTETNSEIQEQETQMFVDSQHELGSKALFDMSNGVMSAAANRMMTSNSSTTVTPSSLSSGCLSAVDSSDRTIHGFNNLQSVQVRKVQLYGTPTLHQLLSREDEPTTTRVVESFNLMSENGLNTIPGQVMVKDSEHNAVTGLCNSDLIAKNSYSASLPIETNIDIFSSFTNEGLQTRALILDNAQAVCPSTLSSGSLLRDSNIQDHNFCSSQDLAVQQQKVFQQSVANCLPITDVSDQSHQPNVTGNEIEPCVQSVELNTPDIVEKQIGFTEETHNTSTTTSAPSTEAPSVLRQLMMPDGQVIGLWSSAADKPFGEQLLQNYMPGNLILVQSPDGTIQVPSDQGVPLETLQALLAVNAGLGGQVGVQGDAPPPV